MKKMMAYLIGFTTLMIALIPTDLIAGQRRRVVVHPARVAVRHPIRRHALVVRRGHPLRRALPASVVVRPAHRAVVVANPLVFLPAVTWTAAAVALPPGEQLVWQDTEQINRDEGWVDTNFGVDSQGNALFLDINGTTQLNFAEITFANGNVQVVDFADSTRGTGIYKLLDFPDGRHVKTVRMLAKSESPDTKLTVYLSKS